MILLTFSLLLGHVPSHCRLLGTMSSVSVIDTVWYTFKFVCKKHAALPYDVDNWWRYVSHNLRRVCVRIQPIWPRYIYGDWRMLPNQTTAEWLLLGFTLTEIDERQRRCLVQRTIDATAKNCNANYSGFSRFLHGPLANKFCCPARFFTTCGPA